VTCRLLQGQLKVHSWRLDNEDKQTLAITGLFSIQAVRLLQQHQRSQAAQQPKQHYVALDCGGD
jgi:hypothetical protein